LKRLKNIWVIGKAVADMKKEKKYPYGNDVKVCVSCSCLSPGYKRKCYLCGGKLVKIEGLLYYGYKVEM